MNIEIQQGPARSMLRESQKMMNREIAKLNGRCMLEPKRHLWMKNDT
jgi:hypothetical protein